MPILSLVSNPDLQLKPAVRAAISLLYMSLTMQ